MIGTFEGVISSNHNFATYSFSRRTHLFKFLNFILKPRAFYDPSDMVYRYKVKA